jgi:hypothetical protein
MELTIDVSDYMSDDEIKNIVRDEIKSNIKKWANEDAERILTNMSYNMAISFVNELLTKEQKDKIRTKTSEIIDKLNEFVVFYRGSSYEKESLGYTIMEKACKDFEPEIRNKVKEIIDKKAGREIIKKIAFDDRLMDGIIDKIAEVLTAYGNRTI